MQSEILRAVEHVRALIEKRHESHPLNFLDRELAAYEYRVLDDLLRTAEKSPQDAAEVLEHLARMARYKAVANFRLGAASKTGARAQVEFLNDVIVAFWQRESRPPRLMWTYRHDGSFKAVLTIDCAPDSSAKDLGLMPAHDFYEPVGYRGIRSDRAGFVLRTSHDLLSSQAPAFAFGSLGEFVDAVVEFSAAGAHGGEQAGEYF